jgi:hypothetical protein
MPGGMENRKDDDRIRSQDVENPILEPSGENPADIGV